MIVFICFLIGFYYYTLHLTISTWKTHVWLQKYRGEKKGSQICSLPVQRESRRAEQVTRRVGTKPLLVTRSGSFSVNFFPSIIRWSALLVFLTTLLCLFPNRFRWAKLRWQEHLWESNITLHTCASKYSQENPRLKRSHGHLQILFRLLTKETCRMFIAAWWATGKQVGKTSNLSKPFIVQSGTEMKASGLGDELSGTGSPGSEQLVAVRSSSGLPVRAIH